MKTFYIIITATFAATMAQRESPITKGAYFGYAITTDSVYVVSLQTANDFPQQMDSLAATMPGNTLTIIPLSSINFQTDSIR